LDFSHAGMTDGAVALRGSDTYRAVASFDNARERGCFLEVNAHPFRLDLRDTDCQMAKEEGVMLCVNSDAHSVLDLENLRYGIGQARRGWLEKEDVLNTRSLQVLRPLLKRTMQ